MSTSRRTFVVGVDGSESATNALAWAAEQARREEARLLVVHAWHIPALALVAPSAAAVLAGAEPFEAAGARTVADALEAVDTTGLDVEVQVAHGTPAAAILGLTGDDDVIVIGSRGLGGFSGLLLGSVGQQLTHDARVPVVVVPRRTAVQAA